MKKILFFSFLLASVLIFGDAFATSSAGSDEESAATYLILNENIVTVARGENFTLPVVLEPNSSYVLTATVRTESGADYLSILVDGLDRNNVSATSAKSDWTDVELSFNVSAGQRLANVRFLFDENQHGEHMYVGKVSLVRSGTYVEDDCKGIPARRKREILTDMGITMQPDDKIQWMLDDKLGMFVHWGLYAGPAQGEWYMENKGVDIDKYRSLAFPESGDMYFDAADFDARKWTRLARKAGCRYMNMVTEHHDGYALFDSDYKTAFTSVQTHNRDFVREYVEACREEGLKVGIYKTLINWRYPGYYDVTGTDCKKNKFGYETAAWHKENARVMKEELYQQVKELLSNYGKIDQLFWDGGWIAQQGSDSDGAFFWESGKYMEEDNPWQVSSDVSIRDEATGRAFGLMGMVRHLQPDMVVNPRCGWIGDYTCEEGGGAVKGAIRSGVVEKCMSLTPGWGYTKMAEKPERITPLKTLKRVCADCMVRNMCFLVNIGPDRHGNVPVLVEQRLLEFGEWVEKNAQAIYGTRGGPWQPVDGKYGFTCRDNVVYLYLFDHDSATFVMPPVDEDMKVKKVYVLDSGRKTGFSQHGQVVTLSGLHPVKDDVKIIAIEFNRNIIE